MIPPDQAERGRRRECTPHPAPLLLRKAGRSPEMRAVLAETTRGPPAKRQRRYARFPRHYARSLCSAPAAPDAPFEVEESWAARLSPALTRASGVNSAT